MPSAAEITAKSQLVELPPPIVERTPRPAGGSFRVVRDDALPGGTKLRALVPVLAAQRAGEAVYASPAYGYAQIALAHACVRLGMRATIFVAMSRRMHPRTLEARRVGARIVQVPFGRLSVTQARAREYAREHGAYLVPWGADVPEAAEHIAAAARTIDPAPSEVWVAAGSGTLTRALQRAWPRARHHAVQVGAVPDAGAATLHRAPEAFSQDAKYPPPYPSCGNYDAKVWRFVLEQAQPDALIWNVAA